MRNLIILSLFCACLAACGSHAEETAAAAATSQAASPAPATEGLSGTVIETLSAPPYVYLQLETAGGEIWAAVPAAEVAKGAVVTILTPMLMSNFESKSLQRTFPEVYFGTLDAPASTQPSAVNPHTAVAPAATDDLQSIEKASGSDARTVAEVWAQRTQLAGQAVTVRGKVVKYTPGVMGRNWVHLQDGSGTADDSSNDLTFTTLAEVNRGDTVTLTGTVVVDKDFGAGYRYPVIVEDARLIQPL
jgi:hypothetical protein